jgi:excisionase family DNA binding protein
VGRADPQGQAAAVEGNSALRIGRENLMKYKQYNHPKKRSDPRQRLAARAGRPPPMAEADGDSGVCEDELSVTTVARRCGVPERTVRKWCESGKIDAVQDSYNGHWRISASAVASLLQERRQRLRAELAALEDA